MKVVFKNIFVLFGFYVVFGCESLEVVVPIDVDEEAPELAVGAYFSNDMENYRISVAQSVGALSNLENTIQDSSMISLFEDGTLLHSYIFDQDNAEVFEGSFEEGKTYRLEVSKDGFDPVFAEDVFPSAVSIDTAYLQGTAVVGEFSEEVRRLQLQFMDTPGQNFYEIKTYVVYEFSGEEYVYAVYPAEDQSTGVVSAGEGIYVRDDNFDGEAADLILNYYDIEEAEDIEIVVELRRITEAYFAYQLSVDLAQKANDNPFSEPVQVRSNIENGFGIFALWANDFFTIVP